MKKLRVVWRSLRTLQLKSQRVRRRRRRRQKRKKEGEKNPLCSLWRKNSVVQKDLQKWVSSDLPCRAKRTPFPLTPLPHSLRLPAPPPSSPPPPTPPPIPSHPPPPISATSFFSLYNGGFSTADLRRAISVCGAGSCRRRRRRRAVIQL